MVQFAPEKAAVGWDLLGLADLGRETRRPRR